jgi:class 3 adenylate cyclase
MWSATPGEVIDRLLTEHGGRVFKTTGDGLLAGFPPAVQMPRAIAIQHRRRANATALVLHFRSTGPYNMVQSNGAAANATSD